MRKGSKCLRRVNLEATLSEATGVWRFHSTHLFLKTYLLDSQGSQVPTCSFISSPPRGSWSLSSFHTDLLSLSSQLSSKGELLLMCFCRLLTHMHIIHTFINLFISHILHPRGHSPPSHFFVGSLAQEPRFQLVAPQ